MSKCKKLLALAIFIVVNSTAIAQQTLVPFVQWERANASWESDTAEVAYVGARCSALFQSIAAFFMSNPGKAEDTTTGLNLLVSSVMFNDVAENFASKRGMSTEVITTRQKALTEIYVTRMKENRSVHNNMFHEPVLGDVKFCRKSEALYQELSKRIDNKNKRP